MSIAHIPVRAGELRPGDVIRIGASENYILAYEVTRDGEEISVWAADGSKRNALGPSLRFQAGDTPLVSRRGYLPKGTS